MNISVFCGASSGNCHSFSAAAKQIGKWIGENHHTLIYGGAAIGLMGIVSDTVLSMGGKVIGVLPKLQSIQNVKHNQLTQVIETQSMAQRKLKMIELADAFIALPGGIGTLDEITEVLTLNRLQIQNKPCVLFNIDQYYRQFDVFLKQMVDMEFITESGLDMLLISDNLNEIQWFLKKNIADH